MNPDTSEPRRPEFFDLALAFVATHARQRIEHLGEMAAFLESPTTGGDAPLTKSDRAYLAALETVLDMYPEMRNTAKE